MKKKQVLRIFSVVIGVFGIIVFILGITKYYSETSQQQQVLKEFKWDDAGQLGTDDIVIESMDSVEQSSDIHMKTAEDSERNITSNESESMSTEIDENVNNIVTE